MSLFDSLTQSLEQVAQVIPVEAFVFIGAFIEELIAPIPSPIIMTLAGSIAEAQNKPVFALLILALIGAVGKTIASYILYVIADKIEDLMVGKFGKFFGVTHKEVEMIGKRLNGGLRDDLLIFALRAIPIIPTAPVSLVSGLVKIKLRTYLVSSFLGNIVRNCFYLYLGYGGLASYEKLMAQFDSLETIVTITLVLMVGGGVALFLYAKNKDKLVEKLNDITSSDKS